MFCHSCFPHTTYQRWIPCRSIPSFGFFLASFLAAPKSTQASSPFGLDFLSLTRSCVCCILMLLSLNSTCGLPSTAYFSRFHRYYATTFTETKNGYCPLTKVFPSTISQPCNRLNVFSFLRSDISIMGHL